VHSAQALVVVQPAQCRDVFNSIRAQVLVSSAKECARDSNAPA
jgi:hypothetical protein